MLKHWALVLCLERLLQKPAPLMALDAFAGAGRYDFDSEAAQRSPEWRGGVGLLADWDGAPAALGPYFPFATQRPYPGSPLILAALLRPQDRLVACELHPEEHETLAGALGGDPRVELHRRDGFAAIPVLVPPRERRGLVLLDPPYEAPDELERSVDALARTLARFAHGCFVWWRPLKEPERLARADAELSSRGALKRLRVDLAVAAPDPAGRLNASSLLIINPPFGVADALSSGLPALAARLAIGAGAGGWVIPLDPL